jgi:uncharacterized cysteine cluster protein YcgN (CxxCxxCC family)
MNDWDSICRRCGRCCFEKDMVDGYVIETEIPCRYLDIVTRECKVYHKRFDVGEGCLQLDTELVREAFWLPEACAYVHHVKNADQDRESGDLESKNRHSASPSRMKNKRD